MRCEAKACSKPEHSLVIKTLMEVIQAVANVPGPIAVWPIRIRRIGHHDGFGRARLGKGETWFVIGLGPDAAQVFVRSADNSSTTYDLICPLNPKFSQFHPIEPPPRRAFLDLFVHPSAVSCCRPRVL